MKRWHVWADVAGAPYVLATTAERALRIAARACGGSVDRATVVTIEHVGAEPDSASADLVRDGELLGSVIVEEMPRT